MAPLAAVAGRCVVVPTGINIISVLLLISNDANGVVVLNPTLPRKSATLLPENVVRPDTDAP
jgi:hypothetical protein